MIFRGKSTEQLDHQDISISVGKVSENQNIRIGIRSLTDRLLTNILVPRYPLPDNLVF